MLVNICMMFHEGILNGFWVTERTRPYRKIYYFQFQRATTPEIRNLELRFLRSAHRLMLLYICVKFHENIYNGFLVTERTRFSDRQTDGQTDRRPGQKQYVSQSYGGWGRHNERFIYIISHKITRYQQTYGMDLKRNWHQFISESSWENQVRSVEPEHQKGSIQKSRMTSRTHAIGNQNGSYECDDNWVMTNLGQPRQKALNYSEL